MLLNEQRPIPAAAQRPAAPAAAPRRLSAQTDSFPKMPLGTELSKKRDEFLQCLDGLRGTKFSPEHFPAANSKSALTPLEDPESLWATADTRVFIRCRPFLEGEADRVPVVSKAQGFKDVVLLAPKTNLSGACSVSPHPMPVDATFTAEDHNSDVHSYVAELVELALKGGSSSMLCYGQTGSGKTYTSLGLLQHMAAQFDRAIRGGGVQVSVAFLELQSNGTRDLITGSTSVQICEVGANVELKDATETVLVDGSHLCELVKKAVGNRHTKATLRNAGSSRSHMVVRFLVKDVETPWAAPGIFCLADLAGSESTADAKDHDKDRINETKFINSSLMTLKDCIRARGVAASSSKHVHIPYRQTSLTLILKQSFELVTRRPTKAAVLACVSPLLSDVRHTANTVKYASLLYVSPKQREVLDADPADPNNWSREDALKFIATESRNRVPPEAVLPEGDGRALVLIPEADFIKRVVTCSALGEKGAKVLYLSVWKRVVEARTKTRREVAKAQRSKELASKRQDFWN